MHCGKEIEYEYNLDDIDEDMWVCKECAQLHMKWQKHKFDEEHGRKQND
jgi:hypothetical protein